MSDVDPRQQIADYEASLRQLVEAHLVETWTALPAIVVSSTGNVASVRPAIPRILRDEDGNLTQQDIAVIADCPIQWPQGGGACMTFPLAEGDEVLLVFACRDIDGWWQTGAVAQGTTSRIHDMSDAFVIPGVRSRTRALGSVSTTEAQLRSDDGATLLALNPSSGAVRVVAPGNATVTAPTVTINGNVQINGTLAVSSTISAAGNVTGAGVSLNTHRHTYSSGGGTTSTPVS